MCEFTGLSWFETRESDGQLAWTYQTDGLWLCQSYSQQVGLFLIVKSLNWLIPILPPNFIFYYRPNNFFWDKLFLVSSVSKAFPHSPHIPIACVISLRPSRLTITIWVTIWPAWPSALQWVMDSARQLILGLKKPVAFPTSHAFLRNKTPVSTLLQMKSPWYGQRFSKQAVQIWPNAHSIKSRWLHILLANQAGPHGCRLLMRHVFGIRKSCCNLCKKRVIKWIVGFIRQAGCLGHLRMRVGVKSQ